MSTSVLHITPHMGGGVGRVLKHFVAASRTSGAFSHEIACLDTVNANAATWARESGVPVEGELAVDLNRLKERIRAADVVQIHWWNHPLLYALLVRADLPPFRCVLWAHVNGYHAPHVITEALLDYADLFVLGTPYSQGVPAIAVRSAEWRHAALRTVFASSGYEHVDQVTAEAHQGFHIGYIGTVDYGKMHSEFVGMHVAIEATDTRFIVCGGACEEKLRREVSAVGAAGRFDIRGHVPDVAAVLSEIDVFGYPLQPKHYGASELALIEAMVCGVVPVVMNNGCEATIVSDGDTGCVAGTVDEYTRAIELLHGSPSLRRELARNAREDARQRFHVSRTVDAWHAIYEEARERTPQTRQLRVPHAGPRCEASDLFLAALGQEEAAEVFRAVFHGASRAALVERVFELEPVFRGSSNGSVFQYHRFLRDSDLGAVCEAIGAFARRQAA